ncbi:MAG: DHH family phosphoesterase [Nitrososphaerales archaeon]|nr:DHH family phosphoesterase [Nitrososphaerales archaeon]
MTRTERSKRFPFVEPKSVRKAAIVCHRNADADAYLSAFALSKLLRALAPRCRVDIATPGGMTLLTTKLSQKFRHRTVTESDQEYDLYVAVDVGDAELLKGWRDKMAASGAERILVDHHPYREAGVYDHMLVDESATSAAEMVFRLFDELKVRIDRQTAQALLEGILFDSSHLAIAGEGALRAAVRLVDRGADLQEARRALRSEPDRGEVLAKLKGAQRLKIFKLGSWVAATSLVGSFQAHVARSLLFLGADVAVVGGTSDGETRVSLRETQRFLDATKVKLGTDVAEVVATKLGGHGGGHATAASFSCSAGEEDGVKLALERVGELLKEQSEELK